ncbi:hypothetical protein B0A52_05382 [Exophiala mesophila]|uniref:C2H2-type domain-containing protein n=1 Tax=Exophiala mesophila TaxID=212818 RepID=A0A438N4Q0_EXOME|nr:hypothetical protein B0A52_05382 [Exophiala mesophila]
MAALVEDSIPAFGEGRTSSPEAMSSQTVEITPANGSKAPSANGSTASSTVPSTTFPPPKTDKPRPHVCTTCTRSFARLEHLKRHERSHTKEKPFECPECTRCFARRDLLLRHQQKLHSTTTPASRPRGGRRESAAGVASGRVRKNSTVSNTTPMRPRANTLSHVDTATIGMLAHSSGSFGRQYMSGHHHHNSMSMLAGPQGFQYRGMPSQSQGPMPNLPKLDTQTTSVDLSSGLRTAPPYGGFGAEFDMSSLGFGSDLDSTINPHALHMTGYSGMTMDANSTAYQQMFPSMASSQAIVDDDASFDWIAQGFENQMTFSHANENAIDDSSPSAMSTNSPSAVQDLLGDNNMSMAQNGNMWSHSLSGPSQAINSPVGMDLISSFNEMVNAPLGTISPKSLLGQGGAVDMNLQSPAEMAGLDQGPMQSGLHFTGFQLPLGQDGPASTTSNTSLDSSLRQSSITTASSELVNDHIRNILITGLAQNAGFGQRKYSQPAISSPLSPASGARSKGFSPSTFPSTHDLQRYVSTYIKYFHPHLPFLHIPTLNFGSPDYTTPIRLVSGQSHMGHATVAGGGSCLILSMAAIGALYEYEQSQSKDLFDCAKRLISSYLEERRKANMAKTQFAPRHSSEREDTPLWLVQAMLLNVIYGHNCGDKTAAELASNHCAALVSLARGAELARPPQGYGGFTNDTFNGNIHMNGLTNSGWNSMTNEFDDSDWLEWKAMEERKRTLYAVFILSSMLVTAYNHPPALTNSEIRLNLPCHEEMWSAESARSWRELGGAAQAESNQTTFAESLTHLLMSAPRQKRRNSTAPSMGPPGEGELRPSTFGCLILVNALHNYIWETRQRHLGRQWTSGETEQMHAHIEPALRAWQAAWAMNPSHSLERPNPFGAGPLSADCIPLLDLAYVRLFVNLGRSKEAFWQRDYDAMAEELAKGPDRISDPELSGAMSDNSPSHGLSNQTKVHGSLEEPSEQNQADFVDTSSLQHSPPSRRERHLRKAAFYAADSLSMSDKLGLSWAEYSSREFPTQSAMCVFDCAQVLAEWIATVQERVGRYLGIIGRDAMDLVDMPAGLLLEDEDRDLISKIDEVLGSAEQKIETRSGLDFTAAREGGLGSRILMLTAYLLEKDAVWPVFKIMAQSLETQAGHIRERALRSVCSI